ncbi:uncharacterized protein LOC127011834 [Drosophila biarmipes]|uniref:uncharacterized protein LOC127011834 n=1 Tax=Drosophila biarmipes TaxID=125945 RepID=UPI0021CD028A|nr:uncharacterized protein LOC127011834 [Drosophila biarmipes]
MPAKELPVFPAVRFSAVSAIDLSRLNKFNCNNGTACNNIRGVFNCSNGHCKNMSEFFLCHHKADGHTINSQKDNTKLNGFFECHGVHCTKIKKPFSCDRYCSKITARSTRFHYVANFRLKSYTLCKGIKTE